VVLVKYLEYGKLTPISDLVGKNVLELGSGTGLVGFSLALAGANVMLTDAPELLPLLSTNYELNKKNFTGSILGIKELDWSNPGNSTSNVTNGCLATIQAFIKEEKEANRAYQYIVLADAIFHERAVAPLVTTLEEVTSSLSAPGTAIIRNFE
jgi:predicted nicotinamide N-methyase